MCNTQAQIRSQKNTMCTLKVGSIIMRRTMVETNLVPLKQLM